MYKQLSRLPNKLTVIFNFYDTEEGDWMSRAISQSESAQLLVAKRSRSRSWILAPVLKSNCTSNGFLNYHTLNVL